MGSGQVFGWSCHEGAWTGRDGADWFVVRGVEVWSSSPAPVFESLFQLSRDFGEVHRDIRVAEPRLEAALAELRGMRLMRPQGLVEVVFSFICSQNNHLPRIQAMVRVLSEYGDQFRPVEGNDPHPVRTSPRLHWGRPTSPCKQGEVAIKSPSLGEGVARYEPGAGIVSSPEASSIHPPHPNPLPLGSGGEGAASGVQDPATPKEMRSQSSSRALRETLSFEGNTPPPSSHSLRLPRIHLLPKEEDCQVESPSPGEGVARNELGEGTITSPEASSVDPPHPNPLPLGSGGEGVRGFPSLNRIACLTEQELRDKGFGYRGATIPQAARAILERGGEEWLQSLKAKPYKEAHAALIELPGIGRKVADCICLYGLHMDEAVPVDTHIWQAIVRLYRPDLDGKSLTDKRYHEIGDIVRERFGVHAGVAQHCLFYDNLRHWRERRR